ncbi:MAG: ABC transporter substrate-binding protein [Chloroflexi bacterium]|nr:ABC transporter substrate-binding protein [Chloroflexota bacterium]
MSLAVSVVLALVITACAPGGSTTTPATSSAVAASAAPTTPATPTDVTVVSAQNVFLAGLYVADAEGYFKAANLNVKIVNVQSGNDSVAALVSGNAQYGDIGFEDVIGLAAKGEKNLVIVHNILNRVTLTLVMRTDVAQRLGVSRASPLEKRYGALKGLRLGVTRPGAPTDKYMRYYLRQAGLNPDRDAQIVAIGGGPALLAALESNQIDAYQLSPPTPYIAADRGIGTILIDGPAGDIPKFSNFLYTAFATNRDWASKNPQAASAFSAALRKAMQKVKADPAGVVATVAKYTGSTDLATTKKVLDALLPALSENGCFTPTQVSGSLDILLEAGLIDAKADPAEGMLWTTKYNTC